MTYAEKIDALMHVHIDNRVPFKSAEVLLSALGCRVMRDQKTRGWDYMPVTAPAPGNEADVLAALMKVLQTHVRTEKNNCLLDGFGILDGLAVNDRWRVCIETIDDAYCLAALLINLSFEDLDMAVMRESAGSVMLVVINGWLRPFSVGEFTAVPDAMALVVELFGEEWALLAIDRQHLEFDGWSWLGGLILRERPLFLHGILPGHLPCQPDLAAVPLPDWEMAP